MSEGIGSPTDPPWLPWVCLISGGAFVLLGLINIISHAEWANRTLGIVQVVPGVAAIAYGLIRFRVRARAGAGERSASEESEQENRP